MTTLDPDDRPACPPRRRVMGICDTCGQVADVAVYDGPESLCYRCDQCHEESRDHDA